MRKVPLVEGEYYHIFNRGVDKREIFLDKQDLDRFTQSLIEFNSITPIGSLYQNSLKRTKNKLGNLVPKKHEKKPLVQYMAFCLNPNHFHLIVKQVCDKGVEKVMHKIGVGYTNYFNEKYKRNGSLFQGTFKAVHIETDDQLRYLSAYVNLNNRVHNISDSKSRNSFNCDPGSVLKKSQSKSYIKEAEKLVEDIRKKREDLKTLIIEELGN